MEILKATDAQSSGGTLYGNWAERVLAAFEAAPGVGALAFEGGMLDKPHLRQAERILSSRNRG